MVTVPVNKTVDKTCVRLNRLYRMNERVSAASTWRETPSHLCATRLTGRGQRSAATKQVTSDQLILSVCDLGHALLAARNTAVHVLH